VLLDLDLTLTRRRDFDVLERQDFRTAVFVNAHCRNHGKPHQQSSGKIGAIIGTRRR
jgi:hypothetical protein